MFCFPEYLEIYTDVNFIEVYIAEYHIDRFSNMILDCNSEIYSADIRKILILDEFLENKKFAFSII